MTPRDRGEGGELDDRRETAGDGPRDRMVEDARPAYEALPDRYVEGRINVEYFRARARNLNLLNEWHQRQKGQLLKGYKQTLDGLMSEAKLAGIRPEDIIEGGSADDRAIALTMDLLDDPSVNRLMEADDEVLTVLSRRINEAMTHCAEEMLTRQGKVHDEAEAYRKRVEKGKVWLSRLERVRWLRMMAREKTPKTPHFSNPAAIEASWPLRWLVYVFRSDLGGTAGEVAQILDMPRHIGKWAVDYWIAKNGAQYYVDGTKEEVRAKPSLFWNSASWRRNVYECRGIVLIGPPRHMKTTFGFGALSLDMFLNNRLQCLTLHAIEKDALKNFQYLADAFDQSTARGRRARSLFPDTSLERKNDRILRLKLDEPTKDPQLRAVGVIAAVSGSNNDRQWWDDPVDPLKADNENERERVFSQLMDVFFRRLQGKDPFLLVTATLWNNDDPIARLCRSAERGEFPFAVSIQRAGGPKSLPPFRPLWVERYPASWLKTQYHSAGPFKYACQFEANPQPDDQRMIRRLALYLSDIGDCANVRNCRNEDNYSSDCGQCHSCLLRQHAEFLRSAEYHLSLDPAATSRENRKKSTDRAGLVYAARGDVVLRSVQPDPKYGGMTNEDRVARVRILDAAAFYAGPTEALEHVAGYAVSHKIDKLHIEQVNFSSAMLETFRNNFRLTAAQVVGHATRNLSKAQRLKAVSSMMDDSMRDFGMAPPVCEFPGVLDEAGKLIPHPKFEWLFRQVLSFGSTGEDHCVDAISQLLKHLMPEVGVGEGAISVAVRQEMQIVDAVSAMRASMMGEYEGARDDAEEHSAIEEEVLWMKRSA